ncbi:hypothetical protein ACH0B5_01445 [Ureibacillus sp. 179-F W5.1 NHS]|uniref:GerMN domain-containing protein n=1 Tax=Lysinibacillus halotolerans TaxID=1368476 RepID=A0A3M8H583_9BACI|nr:hypothetical protein [Lysinibacillus halotolerans]RNC97571.1 hypothetical protein EC501_14565 [Lysinibacillus halotolerans]
MTHDQWDDDKIENLLSNVPKIHDQRSKDEVLQRLKEDGLFDEEPLKKTRKKFNWIPMAISIAAVCLIAILVPSMMNQHTSEETTVMDRADDSSSVSKNSMIESEESKSSEEMNIMGTEMADLRTAVYPDQIEGNTIFKLGLASDAADSIPVTVLIPNERIQEDFGNSQPTGVELYNKYAPLFNEEAIGFHNYHPYDGEITERDNQVVHTLPSDQLYDVGTGSLTTYTASLVDTFGDHYDEVVQLDETGSPFIFSEVGESSPIPLNGETTQYNYYQFTQPDGQSYLVPNFRAFYSTVEEAILTMKENTNDVYQSVIVPDVDYDVTVEQDVVTVTFTEQLDLMTLDQQQAMKMIEGILLTAANFNMNVQFKNVTQTEWQGFDFTTTLPMPVGANEIPYSTVFQ